MKKPISPFVRFILLSTPGAALYYILLYLLIDIKGVNKDLSFMIAQPLNSAFNFVVQKKLIFKDTETKGLFKKICLHLLSSLFQYMVNIGMVYVLLHYTPIHHMFIPVILAYPRARLAFYLAQLLFKKEKT